MTTELARHKDAWRVASKCVKAHTGLSLVELLREYSSNAEVLDALESVIEPTLGPAGTRN